MKRLTVAIFCVILIMTATSFNPVFAAAPSYARAKNREAYFCEEADENTSLFAVPYTYCVEVLGVEGEWYHVRYLSDVGVYKSVVGYCKKDNFDPEYGTPETTFLYKTVTVSFSAGNNIPSKLPVLSEIALEAAYYGSYYKGGVYYTYVFCQGSFGYIEGRFEDYALNNPTPTPDDNGGNEGGGAGLNFASIAFIVIASLSIVVILIIYFTTKKPRIDG